MLIFNRKHLEFGGSVRLHDVAKVQNELTQQSPHFPTFHDKCLGYTSRPSLARCNTLSSDMCVFLFLVYIIKLNFEREREREGVHHLEICTFCYFLTLEVLPIVPLNEYPEMNIAST